MRNLLIFAFSFSLVIGVVGCEPLEKPYTYDDFVEEYEDAGFNGKARLAEKYPEFADRYNAEFRLRILEMAERTLQDSEKGRQQNQEGSEDGD